MNNSNNQFNTDYRPKYARIYNFTQVDFFISKGIQPINPHIKNYHPKTNKEFYIFERNEQLEPIFQEWINRNH